ncbi:hypothetical protein [Arthrobacter sp. B1805]|uniref:hypothetical protein n=1 Tax=Arthrobacter sp. B1805 TaxID=2058892 RepID=UPI000CE37046|nr:hypothetical protein [Arthrobacter sp. B1805]
MHSLRLDIDLQFSLREPDAGAGPGAGLRGTVRAAGTVIDVFVDNPASYRGVLPTLNQVRVLARELAVRGMTVSVIGPRGLLVSLGRVKSSLAQRLVTGSPHIRLGSPATLAPLLDVARRALEQGRSPSFPPSTPFPPAPTVGWSGLRARSGPPASGREGGSRPHGR